MAKTNFLEEIEVNLLQQIRRVLTAVVLGLVLTLANVALAQPSLAASSQGGNDVGQEVTGFVQSLQGKTQEIKGNLTGDREDQIRGKVRQAEGNIRLSQPNSDVGAKTQKAEQDIRARQARPESAGNLHNVVQ
ncbi:hypothetical protein NDA01_01070 [Trichocoleus desertorum AS-A10]|uniref:hypothetical protein n=1 Tax=Trichocoleus desertorum TaxID=1481672 RepID=UPI0032992E77